LSEDLLQDFINEVEKGALKLNIDRFFNWMMWQLHISIWKTTKQGGKLSCRSDSNH